MATAPPGTLIRVLIADDQALLRGAFAALINATPEMTVVGTAADGAEAIAQAAERRPDVVLMDVRMPRTDGITATRQILAAPGGEGTRVIILTTFDLDEYVFSALHAGASGFLLKEIPPEELLSAIAVVAAGEALLAPSVTRRLISEFTRQPQPAQGPRRNLDGLTSREREVLTLVGKGLSNTEIAAHLCLAAPTVKTHVSRLLAKLGARDRAQLVIAAYESQLLGTASAPAPAATPHRYAPGDDRFDS